ncbi:phenoloxidase-activating factor 2-like [Contarinia nasturtii]|uniref:phenoloxidase-activating factor 2-like n=1 Tax=Contarinia nasturtii TaxID=265458 RepID=UPI0012D4A589|nr:phenoloxidase-activating factor 2-like [Contarinia nasturtii]
MFLCKFLLISILFCFAQAYPANTELKRRPLSSKSDDSNETSVDNEKLSEIFNIPDIATNEPTNITNCDNIICIAYSLCINDKVVNNGTELIDWRLSSRISPKKFLPGEFVECDDMEVPCCADEAIKDLHQPPPDKNGPNDQTEYDDDDDDVDDDDDDDNKFMTIQKCGYGQFISSRIISGDDMRPNEFPWMVGIFFRLPSGKLRYLGGGSLIHESVILTAAHLLLKFKPEQLVIRAGEHDILKPESDGKRQERNVTNIINHEDLYADSLINDIALIVVDKPFEMTDAVNTICLPPQSIQTNEGTICTSGGWGKNATNRNGKYQATSKKIELPIVEQGNCEAILRKTRLGPFYNLHNSLMCAGGGRRDTCKGDGGLPLFCEIPHDIGRFYQTGIVAGGIGCGKEIPGMYVNVAYFSDWIKQKLRFINMRIRPENILQYELFD